MENGKPARIRLTGVKSGFLILFIFSFAVNTLLLTQPMYMLQVYDRILTSGSMDTLIYVSILAAMALALLGLVDALRNVVAARLAARFEIANGAPALLGAIGGPKAALGDVQPLRDLQAIRGFLSSRAIFIIFDLPFTPLFIGLLYFIHPDLFWLTAGGAVFLTMLALANQFAAARPSESAAKEGLAANLTAQTFVRNAETLRAMGMTGNAIRHWGRNEASAMAANDVATRRNAGFAALSRALRVGLQVSIYAYGGYLALSNQMTAGMIFASALIAGRGLQPLDQLIGGWRGVVEARRAWSRLGKAVATAPQREVTDLPAPKGRLDIERIVVFAPDAAANTPALLKGVSAKLAPGECLAIIGPSGAGKSTLVRALAGAVDLRAGTIRLDGADIQHWDPEKLGRHIGYLAQEVELLPGTIAQNIARFDPGVSDADIVEAARKAQVHDLIQRLPQGYDTYVGPGGLRLSGGQRQRVGLARAFFGDPRLIILDEPNANLDSEGDQALDRALQAARAAGASVVIVTQRRPVAMNADRVLVLRDGAVEDFGPRADVFNRQAEKLRAAQERAASARSTESAAASASNDDDDAAHRNMVKLVLRNAQPREKLEAGIHAEGR